MERIGYLIMMMLEERSLETTFLVLFIWIFSQNISKLDRMNSDWKSSLKFFSNDCTHYFLKLAYSEKIYQKVLRTRLKIFSK